MVFDTKRLISALLLFVIYVHCRSLEDPLKAAASSTPDPNCTLTSNPDITGIGVRVAFYVQGLITILGPKYFNKAEKESALRDAFFTSMALTLSTFIYGRTPGSLSIIDGLIVTFLPYIIAVGAENNTLALIRGNLVLKFAYFLHCILCVTFGLTFWVHIDTYGTTPTCNLNSSAKFVVFGHSVTATNKGLRGFGIFVFAFIAILILPSVVTLVKLQPKIKSFLGAGGGDDDDDDDDEGNVAKFLGWLWTFCLFSAWLYEVITVEEILRRNGLGNATNQWTYGQTFALTMVLSPVFDFASAFLRSLRK